MVTSASATFAASLLLVAATTAVAQPNGRGVEGGLDVLSAARSGEVAFYVGGFQGDQMLAFRFGARDERDAIPCSAGVMYEYVARRQTSGWIRPTAGFAFTRIFSCATDEEIVLRPPPAQHGAVAVSGGVRLRIFSGGVVDGSLKVLGYVEHLRGHGPSADVTTHGVAFGMAIHGR